MRKTRIFLSLALGGATNLALAQDTVEDVLDARAGAPARPTTMSADPVAIDPSEAASASEVVVRPGETLRLPISRMNPTRLVTPFERAFFATNANVQLVQRGGTIFLTPGSDEPIGGFLYGEDEAGPSIAVLLEPEAIPLAEYRFRLPAFEEARALRIPPPTDNKDRPYVDDLVSQIKTLIETGEVPGYARRPPKGAEVVFYGPVRANVSEIHARGDRRIERVVLRNEGSEAVTLNEANFYEPGVRALAVHPRLELKPFESTELFRVRATP